MKKSCESSQREVDNLMVPAFGMNVGGMAKEAGKAFAEARKKTEEIPATEEEKKTE